VSVRPFVSTGAFEPTDLIVIFARVCVISVARQGIKVKVVGQELGSGFFPADVRRY